MIRIIVVILIICYSAMGITFIIFPGYIKTKIKKMKNNTIRLYGFFILFGAVMFYSLFATVGSLLSDFKDAAEVLKKSFWFY